MEQSTRQRCRHQLLHRHATGAFAEDGDIAAVAAEGADIPLHPFQRGDHVEHAVVGDGSASGFFGQQRMRERTETPKAIVERDNDDAALRELRAVIEFGAARAIHEPATMYPHHHGPPGVVREVLREHVEREAVLAGGKLADAIVGIGHLLHADVAILRGVAHAIPLCGRDGRLPAQRANRRGSVRDALEGKHAPGLQCLQLSGLHGRDRWIGRRRRCGASGSEDG